MAVFDMIKVHGYSCTQEKMKWETLSVMAIGKNPYSVEPLSIDLLLVSLENNGT